jgi:hypothetical protein
MQIRRPGLYKSNSLFKRAPGKHPAMTVDPGPDVCPLSQRVRPIRNSGVIYMLGWSAVK